jgi:ubiquitin-conjugating enzyme E2 variant
MPSQRWREIASHRRLETAAVVGAAVLAAALGLELAFALDRSEGWLVIGAAVLLGNLVADLVSGLVHWSFDRIFDEGVPYLGPHFVRPFREHHRDPTEITRHDFIELNGNTCIAAIPVLGATWLALPPAPGHAAANFSVAFVVCLTVWTVLTNQFHQWAHQAAPSRWVRLLQRGRIVLSKEHHAEHHVPPFDRRFCITSGVVNPVLDRLRVFPTLEWILRRPGSAGRLTS